MLFSGGSYPRLSTPFRPCTGAQPRKKTYPLFIHELSPRFPRVIHKLRSRPTPAWITRWISCGNRVTSLPGALRGVDKYRQNHRAYSAKLHWGLRTVCLEILLAEVRSVLMFALREPLREMKQSVPRVRRRPARPSPTAYARRLARGSARSSLSVARNESSLLRYHFRSFGSWRPLTGSMSLRVMYSPSLGVRLW